MESAAYAAYGTRPEFSARPLPIRQRLPLLGAALPDSYYLDHELREWPDRSSLSHRNSPSKLLACRFSLSSLRVRAWNITIRSQEAPGFQPRGGMAAFV